MQRVRYFADIKGHKEIVSFLQRNISSGTLSHFIIFEGPEGIGKTSLARLVACELTHCSESERDSVINDNVSTDSVKLYNLSIDGGKDAATSIVKDMNTSLSQSPIRVIVADEAHGISNTAQDTLLEPLEHIPPNVYILLSTTDLYQLKPTLRSRAVTLHLRPLAQGDIVALLSEVVERNKLVIQRQQAILPLLAQWCEGKPRVAINLLESFGQDVTVSEETVKAFIGYQSVDDILPLLRSYSHHVSEGVAIINEMTISESLIDIVIECLRVIHSHASYKLSLQDARKVREAAKGVSETSLIVFLHGLTQGELTRRCVLNAYIASHPMYRHSISPKEESSLELQTIGDNTLAVPLVTGKNRAPALSELLSNSKGVLK